MFLLPREIKKVFWQVILLVQPRSKNLFIATKFPATLVAQQSSELDGGEIKIHFSGNAASYCM
jgi:hypothetical protein